MKTSAQSLSREEVLAVLREHKHELVNRFGVLDLALFGSTARNEARPTSDVDILVSFDGPANSRQYFGVLFFLEDLLEHEIDLVTDKALRADFRPFVEAEAVHV